MPIQIHTVVSEPFAENSYIVWRDGSRAAFVVDPGFEPDAIREALSERDLALAAIVCTHGHVDHIAGNAELKRHFPDAPLIIGHGDAPMLTDAALNLSGAFGLPIVSPPADRTVTDGERFAVAGIELDTFELPGHSPGHVVFLIRNVHPPLVLGGDVLFRGSIGRVDFPGGSFELLKAGIERVLWSLPPGTIVYPGHGPVTSVGHEMATNPFVGRGAGSARGTLRHG